MSDSESISEPPETVAGPAGDRPSHTLLVELARRWLVAHDAGNPLSVSELCRDHPELADQLRQVIEVLQYTSSDTTTFRPAATRLANAATHPGGPGGLPRRVGRFEVREYLGGGAFGWVYRAFDPTLRREVAVKVPRPERIETSADRERFLNEARAAATVRHPNVVPVYEVGEEAGTPFIVMGFVPGPTLAKVLADRRGPFPLPEAAAVVRTLALAVHAAHEKGVVHRDLKPGNVLLDTETGEYAVGDFGLARVPEPGDVRSSARGMVGTPGYMPPEQVRGESAAVGPRSDVYALGVILFELVAYRLPFTGRSVADVLAQVLVAPLPSACELSPDLPPEFDELCRRAMAKDPADRFASARELAEALVPFLAPAAATLPASAATPTVDYAIRKPLASVMRRRAGVAAALLVVAVAGYLAFVYSRTPAPRNPDGDPDGNGTRSDPNDQRPAFDPAAERRAAEWVLEHGGKVEVADAKTGGTRKVAEAAQLPAAFRVRRIELPDGAALTDAAELANLADLGELELGQCPNLTDAGFTVLARNPSLTKLVIEHAPRVTDAGVKNLENHQKLRGVYLTDTGMTAAGVASIATIAGLRELSFHGHTITDDWLAAAARAVWLEQLYTGYSIGRTGAGIGADGFVHLAKLKNVYLLDLDSAVVDLGALKGFPEMPSLTQLFLRRTAATDSDLAAVLAKNPGLRTLGLHDTRVTDAGMPAVARLPALEKLYLDGTAVGDEGLKLLAECQTLRWVRVHGTKVTPAGIAGFKKLLPDCRVIEDAREE
jgi:tRNA A-37 threonylcarbamoyl transferase component Bud32